MFWNVYCNTTVVGGVLPMLHDGCVIIHEPPILIYHACLVHTSLMLCVVMSMVTVLAYINNFFVPVQLLMGPISPPLPVGSSVGNKNSYTSCGLTGKKSSTSHN